MSIGDALAEARRQAGLTVPQVAQRVRIRESIIRGIEQDDFSVCGGDFYARGHIRSIADVVGVDPGPLIREYDAEHRPPSAMSAANVFEPSTPIKIREPRSRGLGMTLAAVLLGAVEYATAVIFHSWLDFPFALVAGCLLFFCCWIILKKFRIPTLQRRTSSTLPSREDEHIPDDNEDAEVTRANRIWAVANMSERFLLGASAAAGITAIVQASTNGVFVGGLVAVTAATSLLSVAIAAVERRQTRSVRVKRAQTRADEAWDAFIATREG